MKTPIARYVICTITSKDIELKYLRDRIKQNGVTDEEIYRKGLEIISNEQLTQNNIS